MHDLSAYSIRNAITAANVVNTEPTLEVSNPQINSIVADATHNFYF